MLRCDSNPRICIRLELRLACVTFARLAQAKYLQQAKATCNTERNAVQTMNWDTYAVQVLRSQRQDMGWLQP